MHHRSCVGFRSSSSSEVKRSCRRFLSVAAVHLIRRSLSFEYASTSGRLRMMSRTSVANSLDSAATTWSNRVLWLVMLQVANCALTCANQTSGSVGQKGGILMETVATEAGTGGGACSSGSWTTGASDIVRSLVGRQLGQSEQDSEGRPGHQYNDRRYKIELGLQLQVVTRSAQGNIYTCVTTEYYNNGTKRHCVVGVNAEVNGE